MSGGEEAAACPVCFSEFDGSAHSPSTLSCGHTFCSSCLRHPSLAVGGRLRCPICRCLSRGRGTAHWNADAQQERATGSAPAERAGVPSFSLQPNPAHRPLRLPPWPVGFGGADESWFLQRCALCCRGLPSGPYRLDCGHTLCPGCLGLLLALASPGWVTFLYCPRCQGQTAIFRTTSTAAPPASPPPAAPPPATPPPAAPERRPSASSVAQSLGRGRGRCCALRASCLLL